MNEAQIKADILLELSKADVRLFKFQCGTFQLADGRYITVGMPGMSDLIGWTRLQITPAMVGKKIAVFTSIEVKGPKGRLGDHQHDWLKSLEVMGACCGVARSVDDARDIILNFYEQLRSDS